MTILTQSRPAVLVVEPRLAHSLWIASALKAAGLHNYQIESDPLVAIEAFTSGRFGLVLAAWPFRFDGWEWISAAKAVAPQIDTPVVAMVTDPAELQGRLARKGGPDDVLTKPFAGCDLADLLGRRPRTIVRFDNVVDFTQYRQMRRRPTKHSAGAT